ncbi:DnaJ-domain-containing protein [Atractiella rhizophila]|nr:DnaJ-domain-containing protein [Atractiella rhizophila]
MSTSKGAEKKVEELIEDEDIDKILNQEASLLTREEEMNRIHRAFKMNPYEILGLDMLTATAEDIRKTYRRRSLLIHPDKFKGGQRGIDAFDMLKKAEAELSDAKKKEVLDQTIKDARMLVLRNMKPPLPQETPDDHPRLKSLDPPLSEMVRMKTKELLIDEELRRRRVKKMTMIAEGAEAKKKEDEVVARKRKAEEDKAWEDSREDRVSDWRSFQTGGKKKKKKLNVLG